MDLEQIKRIVLYSALGFFGALLLIHIPYGRALFGFAAIVVAAFYESVEKWVSHTPSYLKKFSAYEIEMLNKRHEGGVRIFLLLFGAINIIQGFRPYRVTSVPLHILALFFLLLLAMALTMEYTRARLAEKAETYEAFMLNSRNAGFLIGIPWVTFILYLTYVIINRRV